MNRTSQRSLVSLFLATCVLFSAASAAAHSVSGTMVGVRGGSYTDTDEPFVGIELLSSLGNHFYFNPNVEYVFVQDGTFGTLNFDLHVDIPTESPLYLWVGGGLGLLYTDPPGSGGGDVDAKPNILGGIGLQAGRVIPYLQVKLIAGDRKELVVAGGLRF